MNWKMLELAVERLNVSQLREWKNVFLGMSVWMQAVVVGTLVLLVGVSVLSCWWGIRMKRTARFAAGAAGVFHILLVILTTEYSLPMPRALLISAVAGAGAGFLYAFLERIFQFAAGFVFGTVLSVWVLPEFFHMKATVGKGRIWTLVIAAAAGLLFALLAKKLKFVLTALEGGVVLGLLCDAYLPVTEIPWIRDRLTPEQILNLFPLAVAASGVLIQFFQLLAIRAEQKALAIPTGGDEDRFGRPDHSQGGVSGEEASEENALQNEDTISMAQAEEVLVEKAKELALAAARSAEHARLKERCEDVAAGLYSAKVASERLGMSEEAFVTEMRKAGYLVPGMEPLETGAAGDAGEERTKSGEENTKKIAGEESEVKERPDTDQPVMVQTADEGSNQTADEGSNQTAEEGSNQTADEGNNESV